MTQPTDTEILDWLDKNLAVTEYVMGDRWTVTVNGWVEGEDNRIFKRCGTTLRDAAIAAMEADRGYGESNAK